MVFKLLNINRKCAKVARSLWGGLPEVSGFVLPACYGIAPGYEFSWSLRPERSLLNQPEQIRIKA